MTNLPAAATAGNDKLVGLTADEAIAFSGDPTATPRPIDRLLPAVEFVQRLIHAQAEAGCTFSPKPWVDLCIDVDVSLIVLATSPEVLLRMAEKVTAQKLGELVVLLLAKLAELPAAALDEQHAGVRVSASGFGPTPEGEAASHGREC